MKLLVWFPDMMTTGLHGTKLAEVKFGDTVLVLGICPVGLMVVAGAKLMGAAQLIAAGDLDTLYSYFSVTQLGGIIANLNVFAKAKSFNIPADCFLGLVGHQTLKGGLCQGERKRMEILAAVVQVGGVDPGKMITINSMVFIP